MRIRAAMIVIAGLALVLAGCSIPTTQSDYIRVFGTEPQVGLVTTNTAETGGGWPIDLMFTGLYTYDADGNSIPAMVDHLDTTDSQHYTITIKKGWKFSDGTEVKAHNYVDAWNYGAYTPNAQRQQSFFAPIEGYDQVAADKPTATTLSGLRVTGDYSFTVTLTKPAIDFQKALGFTPFKPMPDVAFKDMKAFGEHPIGNGPYIFKQWRHNLQIDLTANPNYPGPNRAKNKGISFIIYASTDTAYTDLLAGNLDEINPLPTSALRTYKKELGKRALTRATAQMTWITIPYHLPHFSGPEGVLRRQALSMAINRPQIIKAILAGNSSPARDFTAPTLPGYQPTLPGADVLDYNPRRALDLWNQADRIAPWSGPFVIASNAEGGNKDWIDAVCNSIANTLHIRSYGQMVPTFKQLLDQATSGTIRTAFRGGWLADYPSMLEFLEPNWKTGAGNNMSGYSNPAFDALLDQAEAQTDEQSSYRIVAQAQQLLLHDLPGIPFNYSRTTAGVSEGTTARIMWNGTVDYANMTKE